MSYLTAFVIYLAFFRLGIIAVGAICIILGYRLFIKGIESGKKKENETSINAKFGKWRFVLNDAAPGTCFALFGSMIICFMLYSGGPEMTLTQIRENAVGEGTQKVCSGKDEFSVQLRSEDQSPISSALNTGSFYAQTNPSKAINSYKKAVNLMASPMNYLAWHYQEQGKLDLALALSGLAVQLYPENAAYLDTLATVYTKKGKPGEAKKYLQKAAQLDPKYRKKLEQ
ncbi:conserved hypothetical protein, membrane [Candidatus Magnetomorum sp. HK-1]|nr:conserved hypothetical protein, membrane [Candidatus Magnetomorum sp. HK-1]